MTTAREKFQTKWLNAIGRSLLKRLDSPNKAYEKRISNNMESLYRVIRKRRHRRAVNHVLQL